MKSTSNWWKNSTVVIGILGASSTVLAAIISPVLANYYSQLSTPLELKYIIYKAGWNSFGQNEIKINDVPVQSLSTYVVHFTNDGNKDLENVDICYKLSQRGQIVVTNHKTSVPNYLGESLSITGKQGCNAGLSYGVIRAKTSLNQYFLVKDEPNVRDISMDVTSDKVRLDNTEPRSQK